MSEKYQYTHELFEKLAGIELVQIIEEDDEETSQKLHIFIYSGMADQAISTCRPSELQGTTDWVKSVLQDNSYEGLFYLSFSDNKADAAKIKRSLWVIVDIGQDYQWVETIWPLGEYMDLIPVDASYQLKIMWYAPQYVAYLSYKRHIEIRKVEVEALRKLNPNVVLRAFDPSKYD